MSTRSRSKAMTFDPARRRLLGGVAAAGTVAALATATRAQGSPRIQIAGQLSSRGASVPLISLDGIHAGTLNAMQGGSPYLEVSPYQVIPEQKEPGRFVTGTRCRPMEIAFGSGMTPAFYQAMARAVTYSGVSTPLSGEVLHVTTTGQRIGRLQFQDATLTQMILPAVNPMMSKEGANFQATLQPTNTSYEPQAGALNMPGFTTARRNSATGFRLSIMGIENASQNASGVDAITMNVVRAKPPVGREREEKNLAPPLAIEASNLIFRVASNRAQPLYNWFTQFAQQPTPDNMRPGVLEYVDVLRSVVVGSVSFERLGLVRLNPVMTTEKVEVEAELFCEGITLNLAGMA